MEISRRDFVKYAGATTALAATGGLTLGGCSDRKVEIPISDVANEYEWKKEIATGEFLGPFLVKDGNLLVVSEFVPDGTDSKRVFTRLLDWSGEIISATDFRDAPPLDGYCGKASDNIIQLEAYRHDPMTLYNLLTGEIETVAEDGYLVDISPDGQRMVYIKDDHLVRFDRRTGKHKEMKDVKGSLDVRIAGDKVYFRDYEASGYITEYNIKTDDVRRFPAEFPGNFCGDDDHFIYTRGFLSDNSLRIRDVNSGEDRELFNERVSNVSYDPTSRTVVFASSRGSGYGVYRADIRSGKVEKIGYFEDTVYATTVFGDKVAVRTKNHRTGLESIYVGRKK